MPDLALTSADPTEREVTVSTSEKIKARAEQLVGKAVRKTAHAVGNKTTEAKGCPGGPREGPGGEGARKGPLRALTSSSVADDRGEAVPGCRGPRSPCRGGKSVSGWEERAEGAEVQVEVFEGVAVFGAQIGEGVVEGQERGA